jgi:hypothetical protein
MAFDRRDPTCDEPRGYAPRVPRIPDIAIRIAIGAGLVALTAYSAWQRWEALAVSPFPLGVDGYFYPLEVRALLEHGALQYPASPLTFWFMVPFAAMTDPITGAKLGAAIGPALVALPAYAIGARLGRSRGAGLVAAALASMTASSQYLSTEFVKQGFGLTVGLTALWLLLRMLDRPTRPRIAVFALATLATLLTHKLAAGLVIGFALPAIIDDARGRGALRGRRLLYLLVIGAIALVVIIVLGLVAPQRFMSPADVALVRVSHAEWSLPALALPHYRLVFGHEAALGIVAAITAIVALARRPYDHKQLATRVVAIGAIALAIIIAIPWLAVDDPQGLGFRLRLSAHIPLALCAAIATQLIPRYRDAICAVIAIVLALRLPVDRAEGRVLMHPALVSAALAAKIPPGKTVIVPERHILFMVAYYTRAPVSLRPESIAHDDRMRMMPLAFIGADSPLEHALDDARALPDPPLGLHPRHRNGLVLVSEATWDWLVARVGAKSYWAKWPTI